MRVNEPLRLAQVEPQRTATMVVREVRARARRDAAGLGVTLGQLPDDAVSKSRVYLSAKTCAEWATAGRGKAEEVAVALKDLRADLDGIEAGRVPWRTPDLTWSPGLVIVASAARLALADDRTVEALEVAVLASVDERTVRGAAQAGALHPVGPGRPMRFAAEEVRAYLYARGVRGFTAPAGSSHTVNGSVEADGGVTEHVR
jgi:hypothetical protein